MTVVVVSIFCVFFFVVGCLGTDRGTSPRWLFNDDGLDERKENCDDNGCLEGLSEYLEFADVRSIAAQGKTKILSSKIAPALPRMQNMLTPLIIQSHTVKGPHRNKHLIKQNHRNALQKQPCLV